MCIPELSDERFSCYNFVLCSVVSVSAFWNDKYYTGCRNGNRYTGFWLADIVSLIELHNAVTILMLALGVFVP